MEEIKYMKKAIMLAKKGQGWVNPNPMVGAVIVQNGKIIGEGFHERFGGLHAERNALQHCRDSPKGATMYVTLEPCCHHGKTPPCTEAIIQSGIQKVVIGTLDPNPLVAGKGAEILREQGIEVVIGMLEQECKALIKIFSHYMLKKTPYITMKYAMTMDGKTATETGESKWITGEKARRHVHQERHAHMAIMVGVDTVLADNPMLTSRLKNTKNPIRIICDTNLRTPLDCDLVKTAMEIRTILATSETERQKTQPYIDAGCEIVTVPKKDEHLDIAFLVKLVGEMGIDSVFLEGGATLNGSFMMQGLVNGVLAYIAPKLFGGALAKSPIAGTGVAFPTEAVMLSKPKISRLGQDILLESEVESVCSREL